VKINEVYAKFLNFKLGFLDEKMREMRNCDSVMFFLDETYLNDAYLTSEVLVGGGGGLGLT
jgi:hypothetical protein